ncbi:MAG: glutamate-1-semialdehyde 2,1-aminomutase [Candidatus Marinimicrobia bacterium]|nr:glutamate-1-semialdehyde 2,1-aminomutase [Candidatus Neomarinimicrobiota bacterium]
MTKSQELMQRAQKSIPGGVNSPVRAYKSVGGTPPFISRGEGAFVYDVDGKRYLDFVGSWGPMILGHAHPAIIAAVQKIATQGLSFGAPTELEIDLAELIIDRVPGLEMIRLVSSGTEATMSAIRVARGVTGRDKIIKFDGNYHGHADAFLIAAGSGAMTLGEPNSPGVPRGTAADTLLAQFNDLDSVEIVFKENSDQIAAVIVEPVNGNTGCIPPKEDFLHDLKSLCHKHGSLLILDEVMTGFRIAAGGAVERYSIDPDLITYGKVIGGGMPIGAYGGKREYMEQVAPAGSIYQAGTLSGNPVAVTAGMETLKRLTNDTYETLEQLGQQLEAGIQSIISRKALPLSQHRVGSMFTLFFTPELPWNTKGVESCDIDRFNKYFHIMLENAFYLAPSQYEAGFLSVSHKPENIDDFLNSMESALNVVF